MILAFCEIVSVQRGMIWPVSARPVVNNATAKL